MRVTFFHFVRNMLPFHKRQTKRLGILRIVAAKMDAIMDFVAQFRREVRYELNVTAETMSFENWLNNKYAPSQRRIKIIHAIDSGGLTVGLESEDPAWWKTFWLEGEGEGLVIYAVTNESSLGITTDFAVSFPASFSADVAKAIEIEVRQHKPLGRTFQIINN